MFLNRIIIPSFILRLGQVSSYTFGYYSGYTTGTTSNNVWKQRHQKRQRQQKQAQQARQAQLLGRNVRRTMSTTKFMKTSEVSDDTAAEEQKRIKSYYYQNIEEFDWNCNKIYHHLQHILHRSPDDICKSVEEDNDFLSWRPRMAKDINYAKSVQDSWMEELSSNKKVQGGEIYCCPIQYSCRSSSNDNDNIQENDKGSTSTTTTFLYGHLIWNEKAIQSITSKEQGNEEIIVKPIVLFHTGAGPQDIFLHWKAHTLCLNNEKCIVFIADMISDPYGTIGWNTDRTLYGKARDDLLQQIPVKNIKDEQKQIQRYRPMLQQRIQCTFDVITKVTKTASTNINVMGWCFGGHPILEIILISNELRQQVSSATTFHGVIDGIKTLLDHDQDDQDNNYNNNNIETSVVVPQEENNQLKLLVCHGRNDPFISHDDLILYQKYLSKNNNIQWSILEFNNVRHGFTNPAQDYNPNKKAFQYNTYAAKLSWKAALTNLSS